MMNLSQMAAARDSAPHGTCPTCGWSGHDWAFDHQPRCTKCYRRKRTDRARSRERVNVEKRLMRTAQAEEPHSVLHRTAVRVPLLAGALIASGVAAYYGLGLHLGTGGLVLLVAGGVGLLALVVFADRVSHGELSKRLVLVRARLRRLVEERDRRLDEAEAFYESPEWKAVRAAVIEEQGASCRDCGAAIDSDGEVTVGHTLARSEYPHLALSRDNLRVLCRSCNSRKRGREPD